MRARPAVADPGTAHRDRPDAGLNLALAMMTVANEELATQVVLEIGVRRQKA